MANDFKWHITTHAAERFAKRVSRTSTVNRSDIIKMCKRAVPETPSHVNDSSLHGEVWIVDGYRFMARREGTNRRVVITVFPPAGSKNSEW
jgi:hypothetical protein